MMRSVVCVVVLTRLASAQSPAIVAKMQHYYASASHLTAEFHQTVTNATFGTTHTSAGTLYVAKPSSFRWDYLDRGKYVIKSFLFDGTTLWLVGHPNRQLVKANVNTSALPAAVAFLTGAGALSSQFTITLDTSGKHAGPGATVLALAPKQPSAAFKELHFVVDPSDGHVTESIVVDSSGDTNDFTFASPDTTKPVKPSWFAVDPRALPTYKLVVP
jgi:outer membrane lipoprotein-sorting protein